MPQFVILYHDCPDGVPRPSHWDLLLEDDGKLRAWALAEEPALDLEMEAEPLADHRVEYLTYEGPVSKGRGSVRRWDRGTFEFVIDTPERVVANVCGGRIAGRLELNSGHAVSQRWRVMWSRS